MNAIRRSALLGLIAAVSTFSLAAADKAGAKDIVDTAVAAGNFKTLAAALQAAGLVDTLKGLHSPCSLRPTKPSPNSRPAQ